MINARKLDSKRSLWTYKTLGYSTYHEFDAVFVKNLEILLTLTTSGFPLQTNCQPFLMLATLLLLHLIMCKTLNFLPQDFCIC